MDGNCIIPEKNTKFAKSSSHSALMERFFNNVGPNNPEDCYTIDPLSRIDLDDILMMIRRKRYFVMHAPRQTGKTSCLLALRDYLNNEGEYIAVYANIEGGQAARNNVTNVIGATCDTLAERFRTILRTKLPLEIREETRSLSPESMLSIYLQRLSEALPKPIVLLLDEIDALVGDGLVSVLRQLRSGYDSRPKSFPQSIVLCGVRDVRDYRIVLSNQDIVTGGSAFNIKTESLRLGNFTREEIHELYMQHTRETGQVFEEECFDMVWEATEGQPWLVNALAREVTEKMKENRDRSIRITAEMMDRAKESLIYRRDTHIDILIDKLRKDRVRRVIQPILANEEEVDESIIPSDDVQYVVDIGLVKQERGKPRRISCGIYREIIPRELS